MVVALDTVRQRLFQGESATRTLNIDNTGGDNLSFVTSLTAGEGERPFTQMTLYHDDVERGIKY